MEKVTITSSDLTEMLSLKDAPNPTKVKDGIMAFSGRMQMAGTVLFNAYGIIQRKKKKVIATVFVQGGKLGGKSKKIIAKKEFNTDKAALKYLREVRKFAKFEKKIEKNVKV